MSDHGAIARCVFNKYASDYDQTRRQLIPPYDAFYGTVLRLLGDHLRGWVRIMDLGAGTGLLSEMVLTAFPDADVTMLDVSSEMLGRSRERFDGHGRAVTFHVGDYTQVELGADYDAVVSALSIHHVDGEGKREVFQRVYRALKPGGIFINADQVLGAEPGITERYRRNWLERVREAGIGEEALCAALERMTADRMSTLPDQLRWMGEAGFAEVECWFKDYSFVVYAGIRPGEDEPHVRMG